MDPQWIIAICTAAGLLITWTGTTAGVAIWIVGKINSMKDEILADFKIKHEENTQKVEAMRELVMRHDIILDPEFGDNGAGRPRRAGR